MIVLGEDVTALIVVNLDDYDPEAVAQANCDPCRPTELIMSWRKGTGVESDLRA